MAAVSGQRDQVIAAHAHETRDRRQRRARPAPPQGAPPRTANRIGCVYQYSARYRFGSRSSSRVSPARHPRRPRERVPHIAAAARPRTVRTIGVENGFGLIISLSHETDFHFAPALLGS